MKILTFGIHPDDVELGCGGTAARCAAQGHEVVIVDLTRGEASSNGTPEKREREAAEAARILGCATRVNLGLPDTGLVGEDPVQQRVVAGTVRQHRPDLVLLSSKDDPHPDHVSGGELIERAIYLAGIDGYVTGEGDASWKVRNGLVYPGRRELAADLVVDVSDSFRAKMEAIRAHRSQFDKSENSVATPLNRPGFLDAVEARATAAGYRIGVRYGEPFETLWPIAVENLSDLI